MKPPRRVSERAREWFFYFAASCPTDALYAFMYHPDWRIAVRAAEVLEIRASAPRKGK